MIVAVSDLHLGASLKKELFNEFLDTVVSDSSVRHFVLIGDILDMWRSDPDTLFIEYKTVLEKLNGFHKEGKTVHYVVGNHDYNILRREVKYTFTVSPRVVLSSGDRDFYFIHGYQFEYPDTLEIYEEFANVLCLGRDILGTTGEYFLDLYEKGAHAVRMSRQWFLRNFARSKKLPTKRLTRKDMEDINAAIAEWRNRNNDEIADKFIVYGHTHDPFVDENRQIANTGSWLNDPYFPYLEKNTYVTIRDGKIEKRIFRK